MGSGIKEKNKSSMMSSGGKNIVDLGSSNIL